MRDNNIRLDSPRILQNLQLCILLLHKGSVLLILQGKQSQLDSLDILELSYTILPDRSDLQVGHGSLKIGVTR